MLVLCEKNWFGHSFKIQWGPKWRSKSHKWCQQPLILMSAQGSGGRLFVILQPNAAQDAAWSAPCRMFHNFWWKQSISDFVFNDFWQPFLYQTGADFGRPRQLQNSASKCFPLSASALRCRRSPRRYNGTPNWPNATKESSQSLKDATILLPTCLQKRFGSAPWGSGTHSLRLKLRKITPNLICEGCSNDFGIESIWIELNANWALEEE